MDGGGNSPERTYLNIFQGEIQTCQQLTPHNSNPSPPYNADPFETPSPTESPPTPLYSNPPKAIPHQINVQRSANPQKLNNAFQLSLRRAKLAFALAAIQLTFFILQNSNSIPIKRSLYEYKNHKDAGRDGKAVSQDVGDQNNRPKKRWEEGKIRSPKTLEGRKT